MVDTPKTLRPAQVGRGSGDEPERVARPNAWPSRTRRVSRVLDSSRNLEGAIKGDVKRKHVQHEPGWKWSLHVGKAAGAKSCTVEHVGLVISGRATAAMDDGRIIEMKPGDLFYVAPGHDSWVVGDEPYVSLHFLGASDYARQKQ